MFNDYPESVSEVRVWKVMAATEITDTGRTVTGTVTDRKLRPGRRTRTMIDLHCHIIPGIDDGAGTIEDSLEMARIAAENGTRIVAATSHGDLPG